MIASGCGVAASPGERRNHPTPEVSAAVLNVSDPELGGLGIGDLGLVHSIDMDEAAGVHVVLLPTFLGCPALALMAHDIQAAAVAAGATSCLVTWATQPAWSSARISPLGVAHLATLGIAVATKGDPSPPCPTCGAGMLRQINPVGATACRAVAWCGGCRSVIDVLGLERR